MSERYVVSDSAAADKLFEGEPTLVYWITVTPKTVATEGLITIRDGTDATGKKKWNAQAREVKHFIFHPPIRCAMGLFIDVDANIDMYSVGYLTEEVALGS